MNTGRRQVQMAINSVYGWVTEEATLNYLEKGHLKAFVNYQDMVDYIYGNVDNSDGEFSLLFNDKMMDIEVTEKDLGKSLLDIVISRIPYIIHRQGVFLLLEWKLLSLLELQKSVFEESNK